MLRWVTGQVKNNRSIERLHVGERARTFTWASSREPHSCSEWIADFGAPSGTLQWDIRVLEPRQRGVALCPIRSLDRKPGKPGAVLITLSGAGRVPGVAADV